MGVKAGQTCPQCKEGMLKDTGETTHGERILQCDHCKWKVTEGA